MAVYQCPFRVVDGGVVKTNTTMNVDDRANGDRFWPNGLPNTPAGTGWAFSVYYNPDSTVRLVEFTR